MPSLSPCIEEFDLDIQKWISLKQAKVYLSRNNKNTLQNTGFKGNFKYNETVYLFTVCLKYCLLRLFTQDIHYNKNNKVQKQNETEVKKL